MQLDERALEAAARNHDHWQGDGTIGAANARRNARAVILAYLSTLQGAEQKPVAWQWRWQYRTGEWSDWLDSPPGCNSPQEIRALYPGTQPTAVNEAAKSAVFHYFNCEGECGKLRPSMARLAAAIGYRDPAVDDEIQAALKSAERQP